MHYPVREQLEARNLHSNQNDHGSQTCRETDSRDHEQSNTLLVTAQMRQAI